MGNFVSLLIQSTTTAAVLCVPLYFGLPRTHLGPAEKKWVFGKMVAVFLIAEIVLQLLFKTQAVQDSDGWTNIVGPAVSAYLAGKFVFTRVSP